MEALIEKERAELRTSQLKQLLDSWEKQRDTLYDEIAYRKGQVDLLEQMIKTAYENILNVNKEEQFKEKERLGKLIQELEKAPPKGAKTPRVTRRKRKKQTG